jgi:hypothetical protein
MMSRWRKLLLLALAAALFVGVAQIQNALNHDRETLGITRVQPLDNAPPVLAFTTVALGGFRGLIANILWMRASALQEEDKYFEMAQLADWITKLEPHFTQVWIFEEWNMAWNISVKFKDFADRWRWVKHGMELLRDEGLKYNPNDLLLYRELAWIFQDKMGKNTDDASLYYKQAWANEMAEVFDKKTPNLDELIHPQTEDQKRRALLLRDKFKLDPRWMKEVDEKYGPLEWRLPEAHAIYWASLGLEKAKLFPKRTRPEDLITLRRVIYQSMLLSFQRGRLEMNPFDHTFEFGPNLDIIPHVNEAYEHNMGLDERYKGDIQRAHRYFLEQAARYCYVNNRMAEAAKYYKLRGELYPDKPLFDDPNSLPRNVTLDEFAVSSVLGDINDLNRDHIRSALEGLIVQAYRSLVLDEDSRYAGFMLLARKIWSNYEDKIPKQRMQASTLGPFEDVRGIVLNRLLDPQRGWPPEVRATLRSKLQMPAEQAPTNAPTTAPGETPPGTNAVPAGGVKG